MSEMTKRKSAEKCEKPELAKKSKNDTNNNNVIAQSAPIDKAQQSLKKEIEQLQARYNELESSRNLLAEQNDNCGKSFNFLNKEHKSLENSYKYLTEKETTLQGEFALLREKNEKLDKAHQKLEKKHKFLEEEYTSMKEQYQSIVKDSNSQKYEIEELEEQVKDEKRRNAFYTGRTSQIIFDKLEIKQGWNEAYDKLEFEASVAFGEMNKFRGMNNWDDLDLEGFETVLNKYRE